MSANSPFVYYVAGSVLDAVPKKDVFVTGATGYLGRHLLPRLAARGHRVRALVRPGSETKLPTGVAQTVVADVFDARSYAEAISEGATLVHLVGVARPNPFMARAFLGIDLASVRAALKAAVQAQAAHFVYVSVAQPAPVMRAYVAARRAAETLIRASGLPTTILRPWYVLGPGRRWPSLLLPVYWIFEQLPPTRETALRLRPVRLAEMIAALTHAVEHPARRFSLVETPALRAGY